jgi:hypothetical protein
VRESERDEQLVLEVPAEGVVIFLSISSVSLLCPPMVAREDSHLR